MEPALAALNREAALLNPFAVFERYSLVEISDSKAKEAIAAARRIRDAIRPLV